MFFVMNLYKGIAIKAFSNIKNNLILFLPDIFALVSQLAIFLLVLYFSGLFFDLANQPEILLSKEMFVKAAENLFKDTSRVVYLSVSLIVFLITSFLIGSAFDAMKYGMINDVTSKRKTSLKSGVVNGKRYFIRVIFLKLVIFLITIVPIAIVFILTMVLYKFINSAAILIGALLAILAVLFLILITLAFLFRYPIMFSNLSVIETIKKAYSFFKNNIKFTIICELIIIAIGLAFSLVVYWPLNLIQLSIENTAFFKANIMLVASMFIIIKRFLDIIPTVFI